MGSTQLKKYLVLVVEDNPNHMKLICDLLKAKGLRYLQADSYKKVKEVLAKTIPDLILMDISLKGINGLYITSELKNNPLYSHIPIVILSAHTMKEDRDNATRAKCDGFITKPFNTRTFVDQIACFFKND